MAGSKKPTPDLVYDGTKLTWDGIGAWNATSGLPGYQEPKYQNQRDKGPIPAMDYTQYLFAERDLRSVTSNTRQDGEALLREAERIPIRPEIQAYPFDRVNEALQDLKQDRINGTGLIRIGG